MSVRARPSAPTKFQGYRLTGAAALLLVAALLATIMGGCAGSPSGPEKTASGDVSAYTAEEIVELVRNGLIMAQSTDEERTAANHIESGGDHHWLSRYADPKTWTVEMVVPNEDDSRTVYRWLVLDYNARISFLGIFQGSVIE